MNILMMTESSYPLDVRVRQEATLLKNNGYEVSVIALRNKDQTFKEVVNGVRVYRVPRVQVFKKCRKSKLASMPIVGRAITISSGVIGYGFEFLYFTLSCLFLSIRLAYRNKYDILHAHNPPDTLVLVALFHKIFFGRRYIYDHHDLSPELFLEKYSSKRGLIYNILRTFEKLSCRTADVIITTNKSYKKLEIERYGVNPKKIYIVRNGPDLNTVKIVAPNSQIESKKKFVLCYIGVINIQDGVQYLVDVLAKLIHKYKLKDILLLIIGDGDYLENVKSLSTRYQVKDHIVFTGLIKDRDRVNSYLSSADIFIDAAPYSFLNDNSTFIKHMEYMVFEKPVVSFALKESAFTLRGAGVLIPPNDTDLMAQEIIGLINSEKSRKIIGNRAARRSKELAWDKVSVPLLRAYQAIQSKVMR